MNKTFLLKDLLAGVDYRTASGDPAAAAVTDVCFDSRAAAAGALFAALPPTSEGGLDGHDFAGAAYEAGCRSFLVSHMPEALVGKEDATVALVDDTRHALALASANFFGHPARRVKLTALTGTKGKTTISFMLQAIFEAAGKSVGLIGSGGIYYGDVWVKLLNTTPESTRLQGFLSDMADAGVEYVFLEATSQGFYLRRTDGIHFDLGLYTNISPDHISKTEHPSFEHYFESKSRLFEQTDVCIVNRDAEMYGEIMRGAKGTRLITYGFAGPAGTDGLDYAAEGIVCAMEGTRMAVRFLCKAPTWEAPIELRIPGRFNASNALAAIAIADYYSIPKEAIQRGLSVAVAAGRMEEIEVPAPYTVLIDFAHNRLSMESLMETAKAYGPKRILSVFGLEGNRAHIRRFDSGEILGRDVDYTILANASPRTDDPDRILADIATGIERGGGQGRYEIIPDRREAILKILSMAREGDLVLLIGKGNVPYEEVHGVNIPFSERAVVEEFFSK
ncbi:MAG: UDP-N-acetylmuramoyl-L-alanyl-D-glutamate--2,6-diaminopimelate ligase [Clostridiales Family XIII bacterium]|jgi:UDP-N-acetylmuramoyl-L-alanyl-D-glutamate--2,6-diaminopimelate ligase|nr:UDP-N-acetylmuramoyl-L-alanyl-D-glutamate--2,6-diaminopimelate ligase [Clostridiales Family XIII bacterium]